MVAAPDDGGRACLATEDRLAPAADREEVGLRVGPADELDGQGKAIGRDGHRERERWEAGVAPGRVERGRPGRGGVGRDAGGGGADQGINAFEACEDLATEASLVASGE